MGSHVESLICSITDRFKVHFVILSGMTEPDRRQSDSLFTKLYAQVVERSLSM